MTILFLALGALYFLFIFIIRNKIWATSNRRNSKKKELAPIISNFLFHDEDNTVPEKKDYVKLKIEIRYALKDASFRRVLTEILMDLQKDVFGETRKKLNELYCQLDLHQDAYKKLKDWRWHVVSQGILELTQMQVIDSFNFITKFINDRRGIIRKQAEVATVSLKPEGISYFLDTTKFSISEWQQLKLLEVLRGMEHFRPPSFKNWLVSGNCDVVLFALRLIRHYNQNEAEASIIQLVKHKNERVKMEAIQCVKEFCLINALDTLKAVFAKTGQAVKIEILDTLATLGNEEDLEFLKKVEQGSSSFLVQNKAQMAINEIMPETFMPSKGILDEKDLDTSVIAQDQFDDAYLKEQISKIATAVDDDTDELEHEAEPKPEKIPEPKTNKTLEDIEVFELDSETISLNGAIETSGADPNDEVSVPEFEIGLIDDELDSSINEQIGLLGNSEDDSELAIQKDLPEADHYFGMKAEEKIDFIKLLEDAATDKEILLLEELMQKEDDSEIRYRLFRTLKSIKNSEKEAKIKNDENSLIDSVFHSLFEYASDVDSKLILLKEISEVGDEKELPLLELLKKDKNQIIKKQAEKSEQALIDKLYKVQTFECKKDGNSTEENTHPVITTDKKSGSLIDERKLPLELCFLEDLGIAGATGQDFEIGFELTEEFYQEQERRIGLDK